MENCLPCAVKLPPESVLTEGPRSLLSPLRCYRGDVGSNGRDISRGRDMFRGYINGVLQATVPQCLPCLQAFEWVLCAGACVVQAKGPWIPYTYVTSALLIWNTWKLMLPSGQEAA
eukprot:scaffold247231_cov15-Tisochrysis_lutea.AAC.1